MKTPKEFRTEWVMNPSKEMIVEHEIVQAYADYVIREKIKELEEEKTGEPSYLYNEGIDKAIEILKQK